MQAEPHAGGGRGAQLEDVPKCSPEQKERRRPALVEEESPEASWGSPECGTLSVQACGSGWMPGAKGAWGWGAGGSSRSTEDTPSWVWGRTGVSQEPSTAVSGLPGRGALCGPSVPLPVKIGSLDLIGASPF